MIRVVALWLLGLVTIVPFAAYRLFTNAERDEYAFLITISLFWIFGFWGVVTPLMAALKIHRLMGGLDAASRSQLVQRALDGEGEETIVELLAQENRIPRFLARRVYRLALARATTRARGE